MRFGIETSPSRQPVPRTSSVESLARPELVVQTLAAKFALYLKSYPGVSVYFCGLPVSPVIVQKGTSDYKVRLESGQEAKLEVIEWRKKFSGKGRIVFCGRDGFTLYERPSGVRSGQPFSYTAYLVGARFGELAAENALVMDELHPARMAFDAGVAEMRSKIDGFDSMPVAERGYLFSLLKKAVC